MYLIIGLGNPGFSYAATRHNIGWNVVTQAVCQWSVRLAPCLTSQLWYGRVDDQSIALALPSTWMNLSGEMVEPLVREYGLDGDHLIVVHDDLDLPVGQLRVKFGGSAGGHNGLRSIIVALGMEGFYRMKLGIGRPETGQDAADYVLAPFVTSEMSAIETMTDQAVEALNCLVTEGATMAMNQFNRRIMS